MEIIFYPLSTLISPINSGTAIDAFEVHPCAVVDEVGGVKSYEQCDESDPDIAVWSVYVHFEGGGLDCVADCKTKEEADKMVESLEVIIKAFKK